MSNNITLSQLKSHLWESANILRGSIDNSDFKNYILGMLFFKRLSNVYDEEYKEILLTVEPQLADNPDMHTWFYRQKDCAWESIEAMPGEDPVDAIRRYLSRRKTTSARMLAEKAVIIIDPEDRIGKIVWPKQS